MIYLDNNATTATDPQVVEAMRPYFTEKFANPSSTYGFASELKAVVEECRSAVAEKLDAERQEIVFTSGGTESDSIAIIGAALAQSKKGKHIITSQTEHKAVLESCKFLQKHFDCEITQLPVDSSGVIDLDVLHKSIRSDTVLVSVMLANNETGVIQPVDEIVKLAHESGVPVHSDIVQAAGKIPVSLSELDIEYAAISGHKLYGPRGVGILYRKKGSPFVPVIRGGDHENKMRAGTENTPGIVGISKALEIALESLKEKTAEVKKLRNKLQVGFVETIPEILVNGDGAPRVPNTLSIAVKYIEGESMLFMLESEGILASSGSACTSTSLRASHVLLAMGLDDATAHGSLRFSLGKKNTEDEINHVIAVMPEIVRRLRRMSPICPAELKQI